MVVSFPHPFRPKPGSTQCGIRGCWGWVDDPRHIYCRKSWSRQPAPTPRPREKMSHQYNPPRGGNPLRQSCPTCKAPAGHYCWDMRSVTQSNSADPRDWKVAGRPHEARRFYRNGRPDWSTYGPCPNPRCPASAGEPCMKIARYPGSFAGQPPVKGRPHSWRPLLKVRSDA